MVRKKLKEKALETEPEFRYRGIEPSRIEGFSDAVFGFAITLLVVSLSVPETFSDLLKIFNNVFGFAISVLLLFSIWYEHYIFFLRYGLKDMRTIYLNALLLFTILIYIYPLKFLFTFLTTTVGLIVKHLIFGTEVNERLKAMFAEVITPDQMPILMALYGFGAASIFIIFSLMHHNAWKRRDIMKLNVIEKFYVKWSIYKNLCMALPPLVSAVLSLIVMVSSSRLASTAAGMAYGLYSIMAFYTLKENKAKAKARKAMEELKNSSSESDNPSS